MFSRCSYFVANGDGNVYSAVTRSYETGRRSLVGIKASYGTEFYLYMITKDGFIYRTLQSGGVVSDRSGRYRGHVWDFDDKVSLQTIQRLTKQASTK
jgi:hypothetical protein